MATPGGLGDLLAAFVAVPRPVSAPHGAILDNFCSQLVHLHSGGPADVALLRAGLEALAAVRSGSASAGVSSWTASVARSPLGGQHLVVSSPAQELRLEVDRAGAAWCGSWLPGGEGDPVAFEVRRGPRGSEIAISDGRSEAVALLSAAPSLGWTREPDLDQGPGHLLDSLSGRALPAVRRAAGIAAAAAAMAAGGAVAAGAFAAAVRREAEWHYSVGGRTEGPVPEPALRQWLAEGRLPADVPLWREGLAQWTTAQQAGLVPAPPAPAPASHVASVPAASEWHCLVDGRQYGPVPEATLRQWLQEGRLAPDAPVWNPSLPQWTNAAAAGLVAAATREPEWRYFAGGREEGPVCESDLRAWIAGGQLRPDTPVWHEGLADWLPASEAGLVGSVRRR